MTDEDFFLECINFCQRHSMATGTFGCRFAKSGNFLNRLKSGGTTTLRLANSILKKMREYEAKKALEND